MADPDELGAEDLLGWLGLLRLPLAPREKLEVLARHPRPASLFARGARPRGALGRLVAAVDPARLEADRRWMQGAECRLVTLAHPSYPRRLAEIPDPPVALFVRGDLGPVEPAVAVVGSRRATPAGRELAFALAASLARAGLAIVSGMAVGVDAEAHRGAIAAHGPTVAVLGGGLGRPYPRANLTLIETVARRGAVVSEYPPTMEPLPRNFPSRNRIISGLSLGVIVVEAAERSGSLITARLAGEQGREVFAVPGPVASPLSRGCHALLKQGAKLVESTADVLDELVVEGLSRDPWPTPPGTAASGGEAPSRPVPAAAERVLRCVDYAPTTMDIVVERSGLTPDVVSSMLLTLELSGHLRSEPGGFYSRSARGTGR